MQTNQPVMIVAAGSVPGEDEFYRPLLQGASYRIAADGGLRVFFRLGILPDLWVGDGDSVDSAEWEWAQLHHVPFQKFPCDKDATDTQLALDIALARGAKTIYILAGIGSRLDHTWGNLYLLEYADKKGARCVAINPSHEIELLTPEFPVVLAKRPQEFVSLLPITEAVGGVTMCGFRWNLTSAVLQRGSTLSISNYIVEAKATITIQTGMALVMRVRE